MVGDEFGSPTSAADLAEAIVELIGSGGIAGTYHYVNRGAVSRATWAREVLRLAGVEVTFEEVPASTWVRASTPPRWAVLEATPLAVAASRCAPGPRRWPTTGRSSAATRSSRQRVWLRTRRRPVTDLERPPSNLPGVRYGAVVRHADARGSFRELWRASAYPSAGSPPS